ncbi:MAG TPA: CPBP family intramembrane glutamic endopeptidase [Urbifossiella sp.]|jgi:membrane protease YdiL (CAAX protease family)|nr:CPBP family intramembrane glutamic endopeptidase [Urbifossiella sp.]
MPADPWTDVARMAGCFAVVAAGVVPVGLACQTMAPRRPAATVRRQWVPWTGFEVVVAFLVVGNVAPVVIASLLAGSGLYPLAYGPDFPTSGTADPVAAAVRGMWVGLCTAPLQLGGLWLARRLLFPEPGGPSCARTGPAVIAAGVWWWAVVTPPVLILHAGVNALFVGLGWGAEEHPLAHLGGDRPAIDRILFVLQAAAAAPAVEEVLFRGVLLGWLVGGRGRPAERRVWVVLLVAAGVAAVTGGESPFGPVVFALVLLAGWGGLRMWVRKRRTIGGVYASAALFAAVHSSVWPTPVPLFALGLGLGWVAVRTNSVLAPVVVHGLFNAVSVLFVLSGGAK